MQKRMGNRWFRRLRAVSVGAILGILALEILLRVVGLAISLADDHQRDTASDGSRRVLCLGACYTIGLGSSPEESYPAQLQEKLAVHYPDDPVSVINGGVRGKSVDYFSEQIEVILDETQPDVVVLNVNDRLRYQVEELEELESQESSFWLSGLRWLSEYSVLARVIRLAVEGPPEDTGMPESWWSEGLNSAGEDRLSLRLDEALAVVESNPGDGDALETLAKVYAKRSDYRRAVEISNRLIELQSNRPEHYLQRAEYRIMLKDFPGAWADLQIISSRYEVYHDHHWEKADKDLTHKDSESTWVHRSKRLSIYYATWGKPARALELVSEVQQHRPGTAWAHDFIDFYRALIEAQESGLPVVTTFPDGEVLYERMAGSEIEQGARYGLFEEDGVERSVGDEQAAEAFELLLRHHLERIKSATDERDIKLVVENMSSRPEQQQILERICADLEIPLVSLQEGIAHHPERDLLLHPTQSLRLSAQGNEFMADELFPYVVTALEE